MPGGLDSTGWKHTPPLGVISARECPVRTNHKSDAVREVVTEAGWIEGVALLGLHLHALARGEQGIGAALDQRVEVALELAVPLWERKGTQPADVVLPVPSVSVRESTHAEPEAGERSTLVLATWSLPEEELVAVTCTLSASSGICTSSR